MDVSLTSDSREEGPTAEEDDNVHVHVPDALSAETVLSDDVRSEVLTCDDVINIPGEPSQAKRDLVSYHSVPIVSSCGTYSFLDAPLSPVMFSY